MRPQHLGAPADPIHAPPPQLAVQRTEGSSVSMLASAGSHCRASMSAEGLMCTSPAMVWHGYRVTAWLCMAALPQRPRLGEQAA